MMSRQFARIALFSLLMAGAGLLAAQSAGPAKPPAAKTAPSAKSAMPPDTAEAAPVERKRPVRNPELYSTTVELLSQGEAARNAAYARALVQVVNQLTGRTDTGGNPVIRGALANAPKWVQNSNASQAASDTEGNTLVGGAPVLKASLRVSFDPNPVDSLIAAAGYRYWTGERPKPMLWLSIDDGRGPRLVTSQQLNVIKSLADRGLERGIRFLVPQGTPADQAALPAIQNLDGKALEPINARYRNTTMLIGKVYRSVSGWSAWWLLWQDGAELSRWPVTEADARKVIATGADRTADYFAKRDALPLDAGRAGVVRMEISGVNSLADYVRALGFLQTHASVRGVDVDVAMPGKLLLRVDLRSGVNAFRGLMRTNSTLQPLGAVSIALPAAPGDAGEGVPRTESVERYLLRN
ncbi:DUF2066 domain-containing protein [Arenimonas sp. GDDSR-1]|uniref:DUF2066 domain-containing protein n=1 Tax=Arenimonas sp. GDDSR-1 TaxID=2950125 RepID=UPI002620784D|nr:DUF2066 domain-containing protein [Arenimonas sp. GDDSR-1]